MARPPLKVTPEARKLVESMAACGIPEVDIARVVVPGGIDPKTLRKHFREQLDTGHIRANATIAGRLYSEAMAGNITAMIFWLKTRARWHETLRHEGAEGGPIELSWKGE